MEVHSSASSHRFARWNSRPRSPPCVLFPVPVSCRTARLSGASSRPRSTSWCWSSTEGISWTPVQVQTPPSLAASSETAPAAPLCPAGEQNSKQGDENTLNGVFETVMRVHYPAALGRIAVRTVPCPAVCVDAFSLVSK